MRVTGPRSLKFSPSVSNGNSSSCCCCGREELRTRHQQTSREWLHYCCPTESDQPCTDLSMDCTDLQPNGRAICSEHQVKAVTWAQPGMSLSLLSPWSMDPCIWLARSAGHLPSFSQLPSLKLEGSILALLPVGVLCTSAERLMRALVSAV
jgi:hypothetical protein